MDQFFRDLWAGVQIFHSNFNARYGALVNTIFLSAVAAVFLYALLRAIAAGRRGRRSASTLHQRQPDPALTERAAESLAMAIRIPSVTGEPGPLGEMSRFLKERYPNAARVMEFSSQPDGSLLLRWRARERTDNDPVLFCGHLDVAPGGDGWTQCGPFDGLRSEGRIWGRGAMDCKGIVVAMLEAAEALIGEGFSPRRDVYFAFGSDEEVGGAQGAGAMARLLEKQGLQFSLVMDEGGAFQDIYRDGRYYSAAYIGMGEKRHCEYKLTITAPGGHSSEPGRSTALGMLSEAVCRVESVQPHPHILPIVWDQLDETISTFPFLKRFFIANKPLLKLFSGRIFRDDAATSALIRSTFAATKMDGSFPALNMLPQSACAYFDARLLPSDPPEKLLRSLQELVADLPAEAELVSPGEESFITSKKQPMYRLLLGTIEELYPRLPVIPTLMTASEDARHYSSLSDCILRFAPITLGQEGGANTHEGDEYLSEQSLGLAVEFYQTLMKKL